MSPFSAKCKSCESVLVGKDKKEIAEYMIEHHNAERLEGAWGSAPCGIFNVIETNQKGKVVKDRWLEATVNRVLTPFYGEVWFDPSKERK